MYIPVAHLVHACVALPSQLVGVLIKPQSAESLLTAKLPQKRASLQTSCCPHSHTDITVARLSQGSMQSFHDSNGSFTEQHAKPSGSQWACMQVG